LTEKHTVAVAIAIRDTVYLHDFCVNHLDLGDSSTQDSSSNRDTITEHIINELYSYERKNFCKFIGAGIPLDLMQMAPTLCPQLWAKLDIVSISLKPDGDANGPTGKDQPFWNVKDIDEQADSMARKCIMYVRMTKK
jgi:alpha,alpha-trehalose phosphorylase (configuration-retaining)